MDERDIEFEVVDLAKGTAVQSPLAPEPDAPDTSNRKRIPNRRLIASIALAVLVVVLVATVLSQLAPRLSATQRTSTTRIVKPMPSDYIHVTDGVLWGTLRIDGKKQDLAAGFSMEGLPISAGHHTLEYIAAPFVPLTCHFSIPAAPSDDCLLSSAQYQNAQGQVISLEAYPNRLPSDQYDALFAAITHALDSSTKPTAIMPGERYRTQDGDIVMANQTMTAQLVDAISSYGNTMGVQYTDPSPSRYDWHLEVPVQIYFRYTAPGNAVSTSPTFPPAPGSLNVLVNVGYDGTWHAEASGADVCGQAAENDLGNLDLILPSSAVTITPAANPSDGCLISVFGEFPTPQGQVTGDALFLYRFDVTLAANDLAHRLAPSLPVVAGRTETDLVSQLASQPNS